MSTARALFPGAMGPDGFISCFDQLLPEQDIRRKLILKGGPGVGKSTFMRRLHAALCSSGETATLYFCSGDPDSLDAVSIPHAGLLMVDGTAPHIVDPQFPGARDTLINLGACLDESAMMPRLPHIRACMSDHASASRRARAFLKAAQVILEDNSHLIASAVDPARCSRMIHAIIQAVFSCDAQRDAQAHVRSVITDAVTPKGELCLLRDDPQMRVIRLTGLPGMDPTPVLRQVSQAVLNAGWTVEEHLCPMAPGRLMHLTIPACSTLITTQDQLSAEMLFDFGTCIPQGALLRHECALEQGSAAAALMMQRAVSSMALAKQLHDELETFYVPNMDFSKWQTLFDEVRASLS